MPCRDAAGSLSEAVESIIAQTCAAWELILVDDGSQDSSPEIAREYARRDARIRVIEQPATGITAALIRACDVARAPYIARMDADDLALPHRLELQLELMRSRPDVVLCGSRVAMFGPSVGSGRRRYESWLNGLTSHEEIVRNLFVECPIAHPAFMMRRDAWAAAGGYREVPWPEDYDLVMRLFLAGGRFANVPHTLLRWRNSPGRLSMTDHRYSPEQFRALKRHYLFLGHLRERPVFHQWGAGEVGKPWLREWGRRAPAAVVDINPRKVGGSIHGIPVIAPDGLPGPGETFTVVAVGARGARDEIRAWFAARGHTELRDFVFVA